MSYIGTLKSEAEVNNDFGFAKRKRVHKNMAVSTAMPCQFQIQGSRGCPSSPGEKTIFSHRVTEL